MDKIIILDKSVAGLLTRMYGQYVLTGLSDGSTLTVAAPTDSLTEFLTRFGRCEVLDNISPLDLLDDDFEISLIEADKIPVGFVNANEAANNQNESSVDDLTDTDYLVEADFTDLVDYELFIGETSMGVGKWIGFIVKTGENSVVGIELNGTELVSADEAYANTFGADATGSFIFWLNASNGTQSFVLETDEGKSAVVFNFWDTNIEDVPAPELVSAKAIFEDDEDADFLGTFVTAHQGSVLTKVEAIVSNSVKLNGTPKVQILVGDEWVDYGTIAVDGGNDKKVTITPTGTNGQSPTLGDFVLRFPERALLHNGAGNREIFFTLTVIKTPAPFVVGGLAELDGEAEGVDLVGGAFTIYEGDTVTSIALKFNVSLELIGTPTAILVEGDTEFGSIAIDGEDDSVIVITPTGGAGEFDTEGAFDIKIAEGSVKHREAENEEFVFVVAVYEAVVEPD